MISIWPDQFAVTDLPTKEDTPITTLTVYRRADVVALELDTLRRERDALVVQITEMGNTIAGIQAIEAEYHQNQANLARYIYMRSHLLQLGPKMQAISWSADPDQAALQLDALLDQEDQS
jgi:hypothetical protein